MTSKTYRIHLFYCTELFSKDKILNIVIIHMSGNKLMCKCLWTYLLFTLRDKSTLLTENLTVSQNSEFICLRVKTNSITQYILQTCNKVRVSFIISSVLDLSVCACINNNAA